MAGGNNYGPRLDNRQRGNATQLLEKYRALARDAQQAGDRVTAEYYLQYAEHYFRLLGDHRDRQPEARRGRDGYDDDGLDGDAELGSDDDSRDEVDDRAPRRDDDRRDDRREERNRNDRPREDRPREDRPREDRQRDDRQRDDRPRDDRPRSDRQDERPRDDRSRDDRTRRDWQRDRNRRPDRDEAPRAAAPADAADDRESLLQALPPSVTRAEPPRRQAPAEDGRRLSLKNAEPESATPGPEAEEAPAPKRRGRPRKVVVETEPPAD